MVRSAGLAPASPEWQTDILLLNDDRKRWRRGPPTSIRAALILTKKEQTPLPALSSSHPQDWFHGGSFGVYGTPPGASMSVMQTCSHKPFLVGNNQGGNRTILTLRANPSSGRAA